MVSTSRRSIFHINRFWNCPDDRRGAIAGLAIAVVLLVVGLWLARELTANSKLQDCAYAI